VYEELMLAATGRAELFRVVYLYERTASSGRGTNREKGLNTGVTENTENTEKAKGKRRNSTLRP
jgi:hypothetical protein